MTASGINTEIKFCNYSLPPNVIHSTKKYNLKSTNGKPVGADILGNKYYSHGKYAFWASRKLHWLCKS